MSTCVYVVLFLYFFNRVLLYCIAFTIPLLTLAVFILFVSVFSVCRYKVNTILQPVAFLYVEANVCLHICRIVT